jgi:hypothetical protein
MLYYEIDLAERISYSNKFDETKKIDQKSLMRVSTALVKRQRYNPRFEINHFLTIKNKALIILALSLLLKIKAFYLRKYMNWC